MKQALLVIDMQNGFLNPESALCIRGARATIPACANVIAACRAAAVPVIFVNRAYRADGTDVEHTRRQTWSEGGKPLTPNSTGPISIENPPEFGRAETDFEIIKPRYSAFFQTSLDLLLRRLHVDTVLLAGTTTPNCIRTTCYDAISLDYRVVVLVIRPAAPADLDRCAEIEAACFPEEQAASREAIRARIEAYPNHILLGELHGIVAGYAMGPVIAAETIADEMFADTSCHGPDNPYQSVFSLAVHPDFQRRSCARQLLNALIAQARAENRKAVTLTCRAEKLAYYTSFGFENRGVSASVHGGAVWYDMVLPL